MFLFFIELFFFILDFSQTKQHIAEQNQCLSVVTHLSILGLTGGKDFQLITDLKSTIKEKR